MMFKCCDIQEQVTFTLSLFILIPFNDILTAQIIQYQMWTMIYNECGNGHGLF